MRFAYVFRAFRNDSFFKYFSTRHLNACMMHKNTSTHVLTHSHSHSPTPIRLDDGISSQILSMTSIHRIANRSQSCEHAKHLDINEHLYLCFNLSLQREFNVTNVHAAQAAHAAATLIQIYIFAIFINCLFAQSKEFYYNHDMCNCSHISQRILLREFII